MLGADDHSREVSTDSGALIPFACGLTGIFLSRWSRARQVWLADSVLARGPCRFVSLEPCHCLLIEVMCKPSAATSGR